MKLVPVSRPSPASGSSPDLRVFSPAVEKHLPAVAAPPHDFRTAILATLSDLAFQISKEGEVVWVHVPTDCEFPIHPEELLGVPLRELLPSQLSQLTIHYVEKTLRTGFPQEFSCPFVLPTGARVFSVKLAVSGPEEVLALVRDVTEQERLEREIVDCAHRTQARIGQDLHDGLGQQLTGISFLSRALEKSLMTKNLAEAQSAAEISRQVIEAIAQTRRLARGLVPAELEAGGLVAALEGLAGTVEELFRISCEFEGADLPPIEDAEVCLNLFRIAQEATHNAVKHGGAKRVQISLLTEGPQWELRVQDDGYGFQPSAAATPSSGLGLRNMRYRAQKIGGTFSIESGASGGTTVICAFSWMSREPAGPANEFNSLL